MIKVIILMLVIIRVIWMETIITKQKVETVVH